MSKAVVTPPAAPDLSVTQPKTPLYARAAVNSRPLALAYRLIALVAIGTGIARNAGIVDGALDLTTFLYYTMVSNLICGGWMLLLVVRTIADLRRDGARGTSTPSARWSGAVMMAITVTMLIYLVVLVPTRFAAGDADIFSLTDNLIHIVTPALMIVDWLLFVPKGAFRWIDPVLWVLIPYAYLAWAFCYGALGGQFVPGQRYPYPFMDVDALGIPGVAQWIIALSVALVAWDMTWAVNAVTEALNRIHEVEESRSKLRRLAVAAGLGRPAELHAADLDPAAVACARRNLEPAGGQVYASDLFESLPAGLRGRIDLLICNAPYVPTAQIAFMPAEARQHEALMALDGGTDGLAILRRVASAAPAWLAPRGVLLVETSERQAAPMAAVTAGAGLAARVHGDEWGATVITGTAPG